MAVIQNGDKFDFECDVPQCGWSSREWPEETMATTRGDQHVAEHVTGEPMIELIEFEAQVGFVRPPVSQEPTTVVTSTGETFLFDAGGNLIAPEGV